MINGCQNKWRPFFFGDHAGDCICQAFNTPYQKKLLLKNKFGQNPAKPTFDHVKSFTISHPQGF